MSRRMYGVPGRERKNKSGGQSTKKKKGRQVEDAKKERGFLRSEKGLLCLGNCGEGPRALRAWGKKMNVDLSSHSEEGFILLLHKPLKGRGKVLIALK